MAKKRLLGVHLQKSGKRVRSRMAEDSHMARVKRSSAIGGDIPVESRFQIVASRNERSGATLVGGDNLIVGVRLGDPTTYIRPERLRALTSDLASRARPGL